MLRISNPSHGGKLVQKRAVPRRIGRKGGLNSKLHAVTDGDGKPLILLLSEGQMTAHASCLPQAKSLTGDRGYDSDWFRQALIEKEIEPCIPPKTNRKVQHGDDKALYKKRHKLENTFGWLKDWRRVATRYDRCAHTFFSSICMQPASSSTCANES
jgi:putative transposase